jgi:hypothetical protein
MHTYNASAFCTYCMYQGLHEAHKRIPLLFVLPQVLKPELYGTALVKAYSINEPKMTAAVVKTNAPPGIKVIMCNYRALHHDCMSPTTSNSDHHDNSNSTGSSSTVKASPDAAEVAILTHYSNTVQPVAAYFCALDAQLALGGKSTGNEFRSALEQLQVHGLTAAQIEALLVPLRRGLVDFTKFVSALRTRSVQLKNRTSQSISVAAWAEQTHLTDTEVSHFLCYCRSLQL